MMTEQELKMIALTTKVEALIERVARLEPECPLCAAEIAPLTNEDYDSTARLLRSFTNEQARRTSFQSWVINFGDGMVLDNAPEVCERLGVPDSYREIFCDMLYVREILDI